MQSTLSTAALIATALTAALPASAVADDATPSSWMMRVRAINFATDVSTSPTVAGLDVSSEWVPEVDFTYFLTPNIGLELILATARHEVTLNGASLGKLNHLPPTLTLQYHFMPTSTFKPYVGAGLNYTAFYNVDLAPGLDVGNNSFGGALQAGVDIAVSKNGYINLDVKKIWIDTEVTAGGVKLTDLGIDPVVWGIGYGFRF
jgi:outer membrane protein